MHETSRIATVSIVHDDPRIAAKDAAFELKDQLGCAPDVLLVFFSADFPAAEVRDGLWSELPNTTTVLGCSSFAEIGPDGALTHSVTALGLCLPNHRIKALKVPGGRDAFEQGRLLAMGTSGTPPDLLLVFPDVLTINATRFLRGIQSVLGKNAPVLGGAPADAAKFERTWMIYGKEVLDHGAVALAIFGPIELKTAAASGYLPVSVPLVVTRVENGNVLLALDGKPAVSVYLDFLGPRREEMPAVTVEYPLGVMPSEGAAESTVTNLVRAVFRVDQERNALVLGGDIPERARVRILSAARSDVLSGTRAATEALVARSPSPDLVFMFNCMSRKVILGPRYKEEIAVAESILPASIPRFGFYTFGELSPVDDVTEHHESTFTLGAIRFLLPA